MRAAFSLTLAFLSFGPDCLAQSNGDQYEQVLLPIYAEPAPGNLESIWEPELWIYNGTRQFVSISPSTPPGWGINPEEAVSPDGSDVSKNPAGSPPGKLLYIFSPEPRQVHFNLRLRPVRGESESWGTELPVVREGAFTADTIVLINIPADSRFRRTLRIYELLPLGQRPGEVMVWLWGIPDDPFLLGQHLTLEGAALAYAEIPLNPQFGVIMRARVEIVPAHPWMKIWAFVTVTNNETQHVTTITPQ